MPKKLANLPMSPSAMDQNILVRYRISAATELVRSHSPTVNSTLVFGRTTPKAAKVSTLIKIGLPTKDSGRTTRKRATAKLAGQTVTSMKVFMKTVSCMVKESFSMLTGLFTRETFALTKFKVLAASSTEEGQSMLETGSITRSMVSVL